MARRDDRVSVSGVIREQDERFRILADNIPQLAWMADEKGWIFWYNRRWFEFTGTTLEEVEGWGWRKVHHPDHVDRVVEKISRHFRDGEPWEDTFPIRSREGEYRWFLSRATPIRGDDGGVVCWFGTNTDITEQREIEEALKEADRRKDEFLATLAHELRNPLAAVQGSLQVVEGGATEGERHWATRVGLRQVEHLGRLIDDLLDVSRITRGKIKLRRGPVLVGDVVERAVDTVRPLVRERRQRLEVTTRDDELWVEADAIRLAQVLTNLLHNAAKYSDEGSRIRVTVEAEGPDCVVHVDDEGRGIAPESLGSIFEMFAQGQTGREEGGGGLGIGLTLAKLLVEMHGGSITAHSDGAGRGSRFSVRLPLSAESLTDEILVELENAPRALAHRILVVDDNEDLADITAMQLRSRGHHTHVCYDGPSALEAIEEFQPRVVLLDIGMPDMDGFEVARRIRQDPSLRDVVLVAVTGWGQEADRRLAAEAGFDHHITTPASPGQLGRILDDV